MVLGPPHWAGSRGASLEVVVEEVGECVTPTGADWGSKDPQPEVLLTLEM